MYQAKGYFKYKSLSQKPINFFWEKESVSFRYMMTYLLGGILLLLITGIPVLYWVNQNYSLFVNLAQTHAPSLIFSLEREQTWINVILFSSSLIFLVMNSTLIYRLSHRFNGPAGAMERHMRKLAQGKWSVPELTIRKDDELHALASQYDYFYKTLQAITLKELKTLEKINVDPDNKEANSALHSLIRSKKERLGYAEIASENALAAASARVLRRAS